MSGRAGGVLAIVAAAIAVTVGVGMIAIAFVVGDCAAFGGRCPAEPPPLREDDTFGMAATGAFLATAVPLFATAPSRRRLAVAAGVGLVAAVAIGAIARSAALS